MPCHAIPYHTTPCHAMPCHAIPCPSIPYPTLPYHTIPSHAIPSHTIPHRTIPSPTVSHHTILPPPQDGLHTIPQDGLHPIPQDGLYTIPPYHSTGWTRGRCITYCDRSCSGAHAPPHQTTRTLGETDAPQCCFLCTLPRTSLPLLSGRSIPQLCVRAPCSCLPCSPLLTPAKPCSLLLTSAYPRLPLLTHAYVPTRIHKYLPR